MKARLIRSARRAGLITACAAFVAGRAVAQGAPARPPASLLDSLVALALETNPRIRAARARVDAASARVSPAGARPDPMLVAGIQNLPAATPGFGDEMTMKMVGVSQTFVRGGKLTLSRQAAKFDLAAVERELDAERFSVARQVREAYYEIAYADRAVDIVARNQRALLALALAAEARFGAGAGGGSLAMPASGGEMPRSPSTVRLPTSGTSRSTTAVGGDAMGMNAVSAGGARLPAATRATPDMSATSGSVSAMTGMGQGAPNSSSAMTSGGGLQGVLRARVEATRLGAEASALREARSSSLARLNALLSFARGRAVPTAEIPPWIRKAAVAESPDVIRFESAMLGSRAAGSPLPALSVLQDRAERTNPDIRAHEARIAAQQTRAELARRARTPDVDVLIQFGQRDRMPDMLTAMVSIPIPVQRSRVQDSYAAAARADLAGVEAEHHEQVNRTRADVARLYNDLERARAQLALLTRSVIPQSAAVIDAAMVDVQNGRVDILAVLAARASLFGYETEYARVLTQFATSLAALEELVGGEVLP